MKTPNRTVHITEHIVTAAQASANLADIDTGLHHVGNKFAVQIRRAGAIVTVDAVCTNRGSGVIRVADGSTYNLTENDVVVIVAQEGV
jgi:hypothetical protein